MSSSLQLTGRRVHATGRHPRRLAAVAGCQLRSRAPRPEPAHSPAEAADSTGLKQKQQHRWTSSVERGARNKPSPRRTHLPFPSKQRGDTSAGPTRRAKKQGKLCQHTVHAARWLKERKSQIVRVRKNKTKKKTKEREKKMKKAFLKNC